MVRILKAILLTFGLTMVLLEVATRATWTSSRPANLIPDPILNHVWKPSSSFTHTEWINQGVEAYTHTYNGQSWISTADIQVNKPKDVYRIFFQGDSFVEGTAPMDKNLPGLVQARFANLEPTKKRVELINAGTSSYSPTLYYLQLRTKILKYDPDMVFIAVDMTDVFDDFIYSNCLIRDENSVPIACPADTDFSYRFVRTAGGVRRLSLTEQLVRHASSYSTFAKLLNEVLIVPNEATPSDDSLPHLFDWMKEPWSDETRLNVMNSISLLKSAIELARSRNIVVAVTAVPHREQLEGRASLRAFSEVAQIAKLNGAIYFDSYAAFKSALAANSVDELYLKGDMHFSPKGYEVWAEGVGTFLQDILPSDV